VGLNSVAPVVPSILIWNKGVKSFPELESLDKLPRVRTAAICKSQQFLFLSAFAVDHSVSSCSKVSTAFFVKAQ
jgi:hypothetical protein